jgi:hypothetical protein
MGSREGDGFRFPSTRPTWLAVSVVAQFAHLGRAVAVDRDGGRAEMVAEEVVERAAALPQRHAHAKSAKAWRGLCALVRLWLPSLVVCTFSLNCRRNSLYCCCTPITELRPHLKLDKACLARLVLATGVLLVRLAV